MTAIFKINAYNDMLIQLKVRIEAHRDFISSVKNPDMNEYYEQRIKTDTSIGYRIIKRIQTLLKEYEEGLTL